MEEVLNLLDSKKIRYKLIKHIPVHTIEDMKEVGLLDEGYVCKNLFVRNANGHTHYLICCHHSKQVDMKVLANKINSTRLSFASSERLKKYLNLEQGYVSPFGILNDTNKEVIVVFDEEIKNEKLVGFHPNINTATVYLDFKDLENIIKEHGNEIMYINL